MKIKFSLTVTKWICRPNEKGRNKTVKIYHSKANFTTTDNNKFSQKNYISARSDMSIPLKDGLTDFRFQ